jgi:predicted ATPase
MGRRSSHGNRTPTSRWGRYSDDVALPSDALVGRDAEVLMLAEAAEALRTGRAGAVIVEGEAGIGKTRLLGRLIEEVAAAGAVAFRGDAHPFERAHPFGVLVEALDLRRRSSDRAAR